MKWPNLTVKDFLGLCLVAAFIGAMIVLTWKAIPKENEQRITINAIVVL